MSLSKSRAGVSSRSGDYTIDETAEDVDFSLHISKGDSEKLTDPESLLDNLAKRYSFNYCYFRGSWNLI